MLVEPRIVIWDVDGNLYASLEGYIANYLARLTEYGLKPDELEKAREYFEGRGGGTPIEVQIPTILEELGYPKEDGPELVRLWHAENETKIYPPYPDVIPCLKALKETGYRQCASTNTHQHILDNRVIGNNFDPFLDVWFGGTAEFGRTVDGKRVVDAVHKKTHKGPIMTHYGLTEDQFKQNTVLVGDTSGDGRVTKEWGCRGFVYRIRPGTDVDTSIEEIKKRVMDQGAFPTAIVRDLRELPPVLGELFKK